MMYCQWVTPAGQPAAIWPSHFGESNLGSEWPASPLVDSTESCNTNKWKDLSWPYCGPVVKGAAGHEGHWGEGVLMEESQTVPSDHAYICECDTDFHCMGTPCTTTSGPHWKCHCFPPFTAPLPVVRSRLFSWLSFIYLFLLSASSVSPQLIQSN